ncbi:MAG TPA: CpsB/CapC family capsule biosynthesis tyrosine phosphatase [Solirubrobacterales bacterium]|nr:CpsB/CapC family capsule biosynthesis tyrosine phosphatase [Solirubrobacterales bacterium]
MIDLHCHILPGVDDGSLDLGDSLAMGRQAAGDGIERICATPHIRHDHDVRIEEVAGRVEELNDALRDEGVPVMVLQGGEVAETAVEGLSEEELGRVSLGAGNWILLEPAPGPLSDTLITRVAHLAERGHRALIAHPERHLSADMYERIAALIASGALVQATADFFLRERFADGMRMLAEAGLVHVLSSDAHSSHGGRPVHMREAFERLERVESVAPHLEWMRDTAPRAIVEGEKLSIPFEGLSR